MRNQESLMLWPLCETFYWIYLSSKLSKAYYMMAGEDPGQCGVLLGYLESTAASNEGIPPKNRGQFMGAICTLSGLPRA